MTYCSKCGKQNPDDAKYCNYCSTPLMGGRPRRDPGKECEEDCGGSGRSMGWLWGIVVIVIGLWIFLQLGLSNVEGFEFLEDWEFWWIIPVIIGILIISEGIRMITKSR